jgi:hypothetical protein
MAAELEERRDLSSSIKLGVYGEIICRELFKKIKI